MATGNIKGITIQFKGETTELENALKTINKETRSIDGELRKVNSALKFNPTSIELWKQKQELLNQKVEQTQQKLKVLKEAQAKLDADKSVDKNSKEYRDLQREIIETESKLKHFQGEQKKLGNVKLKAASEQFKELGGKLETAGQKMMGLSTAAAGLAVSLGLLAGKSALWADDINTLSKQYSLSTTEIQKYSAASDLVDVSVETMVKSHQKLSKTMLTASKGTGTQAEAFEKLGVSVVDADGNLRDGEAVFQETIAALGDMTNETERDALAQKLFGNRAAELNSLIEDGGETYKNVAETFEKYDLEFVDQETLNNANAFNDQIDTIKAIGSVALQTIGTQLAAYVAPALEKVVGWIGSVAQWLTTLSPQVLTVIGIVATVVATIGPLLLILGKIAFAISSIVGLAGTLGVSLGALAGPVGIVIAVIGALIAIGVLLYKNWDKIKAKAIEIKNKVVSTWDAMKAKVSSIMTGIKDAISKAWNIAKHAVFFVIKTIYNKVTSQFSALKTKVSNIWNGIKDAITNKIQAAKDKVSGIIDKIKGLFPIKIGNIFKNLKTPHFSLDWGSKDFGKLGTIKYPTGFGVSWYAQGGVFDNPSVIGVGEAGPEAVVPLDKFWDKIDKLQGNNVNVAITINGADKNATEIAQEVKRILIKEVKNNRLAWQ